MKEDTRIKLMTPALIKLQELVNWNYRKGPDGRLYPVNVRPPRRDESIILSNKAREFMQSQRGKR